MKQRIIYLRQIDHNFFQIFGVLSVRIAMLKSTATEYK